MKGRRHDRTATFVQTLIFYDEPQLVLLRSEAGADIIGVAVSRPDMEHPFFSCEVRKKAFRRYLEGKADLHYVFKDAARERYFFFDLQDADPIPLREATPDEVNDSTFWPSPGSFSRSHTNQYKTTTSRESSVKVFRIDGNWSASDFSHFHGKISNLYAMMLILNRMDLPDAEQIEKAYIKDSIEKRFWMGGGSYLGFYDDLFDHVKSLSPLDVERIQYASPGQIALRGDGEAFSDIDRMIDTFDANHKQLRSMYNSLHGILRKERLLRARAGTRFSNPERTEYVRLLSVELADKMRLEKRDEIFEACNRNTLVFCKVILSIYRRANEIYMFHEEGRVQSE